MISNLCKKSVLHAGALDTLGGMMMRISLLYCKQKADDVNT